MATKYGRPHRRLREQWRVQVEAGRVLCARCGLPIDPYDPWDLGHSDLDPSQHSGPEHRRCNRATAGRRVWTGEREIAPRIARYSRKW